MIPAHRYYASSSLLAFVLLLLLCPPAFAGTFYIANNGSDANAGTSKTAPWAHMPGMPSCTANCSAYQPRPGDSFILRGGDTWGASDLGINYVWAGTATNRIYIGVDQTYFSGNSWTRPILSCQQAVTCGSNVLNWMFYVNNTASYVTIDNLDFRGIYLTDHGIGGIRVVNHDVEIKNCYIHGWSRATTASINNPDSATMIFGDLNADLHGTSAHDNAIDGSDTNYAVDGGMVEGISNIYNVYNNYIGYTYDGFVGVAQNIYNNLIEHIQPIAGSSGYSINGRHCNMMYQYSMFYTINNTLYADSKVSKVYNNVLRHLNAPGCFVVALQGQDGAACAGCTIYAFNNLLYDDDLATAAIGIGGNPAVGPTCNYGTMYAYNNTLANNTTLGCVGNGLTIGANCGGVPAVTVHFANTHCISPGSSVCIASGATCVNDGANLLETPSLATSLGFSATSPLPYSPPSATSPTVGVGVTLTSNCSSNGLNALCSDATYPTYDSTNHKIILRSSNARPVTAGWDIGAYQFSAQGSAPAPPSNLSVVAH